MLRLDPKEKLKLDEQDCIILNCTLTSSRMIIEIPTKLYVDSLYDTTRNRQDSSSVITDQETDINNK